MKILNVHEIGELKYIFLEEKLLLGDAEVFFVENPNIFHDYYIQIPDQLRTFHEALLSGKPCRLFFYIEYKKILNHQVGEETLTTVFLKVLHDALNELML